MDLWVAGEDDEKALRGWLFFDDKTTSGGRVNAVTFQAHSVVEENGVLVDITPTRASRRYPLMRHEGGEKHFITFVESGVMCIEFVAP